MRKILFLVMCIVLFPLTLMSENITLSFEGKSTEEAPCNLSKVVVENVTRGWLATLTTESTFTLALEETTDSYDGNNDDGDGNNNDDNNDEAIYNVSNSGGLRFTGTNPFQGQTSLFLTLEATDQVTMSIVDLSGRQVYFESMLLTAGSYNLNVSVMFPQMYFLSIITSRGVIGEKLLNVGYGTNNIISITSIVSHNKHTIKTDNTIYTYAIGDEMRYFGYTIQNGVTYGDVKNANIGNTSTTIVFEFALVGEPDNNDGNNNDDSEKPKEKSGMYIGLIGFNNAFYYKDIVYLTKASKNEFVNTIIDVKLQELKDGKFKNGTLLYEADWRALDSLQSFVSPKDLATAAIVTFTDGEDRGSYNENSLFYEDDNGKRYEDSLMYRIANEKVNDIPITAYAIGKKGSDVASNDIFEANLKTISSGDGYWYPVNNMTEVEDKFEAIANDLYKVNIISDLTLTSVGYNDTTQVCWTFDIDSALTITDWPSKVGYNTYSSKLYITAQLCKTKGKYRLANINCVGLTYDGWDKENPDTIWGEKNELLNYDFTFKNVRVTEKDQAITEVVPDLRRYTRQWTWVESTGLWHKETEFSGNNMKDSKIDKSSAVIMLVLDCSSSLSASDFEQLKSATKKFINVISANLQNDGSDSENDGDEDSGEEVQTLTVAQARSMALGLEKGKSSITKYRVKGTVKDNHLSNGTANFEFIADGASISCYSISNISGAEPFSNKAELLNGDRLLVEGVLYNSDSDAAGIADGKIIEVISQKRYIKHPWGSGTDAAWMWKEMYSGYGGNPNIYSYDGAWGGIGVNINGEPNDIGALWISLSDYDVPVGTCVSFVYILGTDGLALYYCN